MTPSVLPSELRDSEWASLVAEALRLAGDEIQKLFQQKVSVQEKKDKSLVTEADLASQKILERELSRSPFPVFSEENVDEWASSTLSSFWLVDPLDGTKDFLSGSGDFVVLAALMEAARPVLGAAYHPASGDLYLALRGIGAFVKRSGEWKKIAVSPQNQLNQSRVLMSKNHANAVDNSCLAVLPEAKVERMGSALKFLRIAEGQAELSFSAQVGLKIWDTAAVDCILSEAGGRMSDLQGGALSYSPVELAHLRGVVASNSRIHGSFLETLRANGKLP